MVEGFNPFMPPANLAWDPSTFACVAPNATLDVIRGGPAHIARYPALALPEGPDDRIVMPREHTECFVRRVHAAGTVDVLVIGYSGLDREVLGLLRHADPKVRRMTIVDRNLNAAEEVMQRFHDADIDAVWPYAFDGDFASWTDGDGLNKLVDEYCGPYR